MTSFPFFFPLFLPLSFTVQFISKPKISIEGIVKGGVQWKRGKGGAPSVLGRRTLWSSRLRLPREMFQGPSWFGSQSPTDVAARPGIWANATSMRVNKVYAFVD
jgi:hypothetical protein